MLLFVAQAIHTRLGADTGLLNELAKLLTDPQQTSLYCSAPSNYAKTAAYSLGLLCVLDLLLLLLISLPHLSAKDLIADKARHRLNQTSD